LLSKIATLEIDVNGASYRFRVFEGGVMYRYSALKILRCDCPQFNSINQLVNVQLRETRSKTRREIFLAGICCRVHCGEKPEIGVSFKGVGITSLRQRNATSGVI
jgi:hypothetical protein